MTERTRETIAAFLREKLSRWHPFDVEDDIKLAVQYLDEEGLLLTDDAARRVATALVRSGAFT
jgi:hypothetical protein